MIIREPILSDVSNIAKIHVDTWRTAYRGIVPDKYLEELSYEKKAKAWESIINGEIKDSRYIFIAEDEDHGVIGFVTCGAEREGDAVYRGELYAIYVTDEYQNSGVGGLLFKRVTEKLIELGFNSMLIWALEDNHKARRFYEIKGGKKIKEKCVDIGGEKLKEVAYGWEFYQ